MSSETSTRLYPEPVRQGSATATAVYATLLAAERPLAYADLTAEIGASKRAIKQAVYDLRDAGVITSRPDPTAPSRRLHELAD